MCDVCVEQFALCEIVCNHSVILIQNNQRLDGDMNRLCSIVFEMYGQNYPRCKPIRPKNTCDEDKYGSC